MAIYRTVSLSFWEDNKIVDDFTPEDKYFMLYLLTNPHTNLLGCYEVSVKQMSYELGYDIETTKKLIDRMKNVHDIILYSEKTKEILIKNWHKYNWTSSDKLKKPIMDLTLKIKDLELKKYMVQIGYRYGIDTSVTVTDTVTVSDIINYLNDKTNRNYNPNAKKNISVIKARLNEGYTLEDFKKVIDNKTADWLNDDKFNEFLRPETLFSNKFDGYLNKKKIIKNLKDVPLDMSIMED